MALETEHRNPHESSQFEPSVPERGSSSSEGVTTSGQQGPEPAGEVARARAPNNKEPESRSPLTAPQSDHSNAAPAGERADKRRKGFLRSHPLLTFFGLILIALGAAAGFVYWNHAAHFETTDDAFIASRPFAIAPKVSGYITNVPVTDNQHVDAGGVIARIDDRDYRNAFEQAKAQVASAEAGVRNIDAQIVVQLAQINSFQAQVDKAQASLELARVTWQRDKPLVEKGWTTAQQGTIDVQNLKTQEATLKSAQADLELAQKQIETLKAQRASAVATLDQAKAGRDQAQNNLSDTIVTADQPGHVVQLGAAVGGLAQQGTALAMFVPDEIWVTANFKETQLDGIRPGQPVAIRIDAYPERNIRGHVVSVQPGSGTAFSLLPPENATGNFVKVVQRVPVKIVVDDLSTDVALGPGMSVVPTVRIDPEPSLYEQIASSYLPSIHERFATLTDRLRGWL